MILQLWKEVCTVSKSLKLFCHALGVSNLLILCNLRWKTICGVIVIIHTFCWLQSNSPCYHSAEWQQGQPLHLYKHLNASNTNRMNVKTLIFYYIQISYSYYAESEIWSLDNIMCHIPPCCSTFQSRNITIFNYKCISSCISLVYMKLPKVNASFTRLLLLSISLSAFPCSMYVYIMYVIGFILF